MDFNKHLIVLSVKQCNIFVSYNGENRLLQLK